MLLRFIQKGFQRFHLYVENFHHIKNGLFADRDNVENIARYLYDIDGYRVEKENRDGKKTHYVFDTSGKVLEEIDKESGEVITSVFLKNRHLARVTADETLYYGTDHQGSTVLMTNARVKRSGLPRLRLLVMRLLRSRMITMMWI